MKKLVALPTPPSHLDRYIAIRQRKHHITRAVLTANHIDIEVRYNSLATCVATCSIENIGASNLQAISAELRHCYNNETTMLEELRTAIKGAQAEGQLKYCPYCQTTLGGTDDHYLPAILFPEFAVHPLNLVPACSTCNSIKGDDWLNSVGQRQYIQFFTDTLPAVDFLQITLITQPNVRSVGARFQVVQAGMPNAVWQLLKSHFDRLDLIRRYEELGSDEIGEILGAGRSYRQAGGLQVRQFFQLQASKAEDKFGRNHWRATIMRALVLHPDAEDLTIP